MLQVSSLWNANDALTVSKRQLKCFFPKNQNIKVYQRKFKCSNNLLKKARLDKKREYTFNQTMASWLPHHSHLRPHPDQRWLPLTFHPDWMKQLLHSICMTEMCSLISKILSACIATMLLDNYTIWSWIVMKAYILISLYEYSINLLTVRHMHNMI